MQNKRLVQYDINSIDEKTLIVKLKLTPRLAKRILALRPFTSVDQISQVWGIDQTTIERLTPLLSIGEMQESAVPETIDVFIGSLHEEMPTQVTVEAQPDQSSSQWEYSDDEFSVSEEMGQKPSKSAQPGSSSWKTNLLILFIFLMGAFFRFTGLNWDQNHHQHPDERFISMISEQIRPVKSIAAYFDTQNSTLNPIKYGSYTYGMLPLFITRAVAEWFDMTDYDRVTLVGRAMSGIFDLAALWMLYILAKRLFNQKTGILAAALYAAAVFPIQMSHFFTVDTFATVFILISIYLAYDIFRFDQPTYQLSWKALYLFSVFGLVVGMAGACKINALPVYAMILISGIVFLLCNWKKRGFQVQLYIILAGSALALLCAVLSFRVFQPYAFSGTGFLGFGINKKWLDIINEVTNHVAGYSDWPPNHHWTNRPFTYAWINMVVWGLGIPLGLAAWGGWLWSVWRIIKGNWRQFFLPFTWVLVYFVWQNAQFWRYMRYFIPIYPFLVLFAAWSLLELFSKVQASRDALISYKSNLIQVLRNLKMTWKAIAVSLMIIITIGFTYLYAIGFVQIYNRTFTRLDASAWMVKNIKGPLNLEVKTNQGNENYPIFIINHWVVEPGDTPEIDVTINQKGITSQISAPKISNIGVNAIFKITKEENGDDVLTEIRLPIEDQDTTTDFILTFGDIDLSKDTDYYLQYKITNSNIYQLSGLVLRNHKDDSPLINFDFGLTINEAGTQTGTLRFTPKDDLMLNRLVIGQFGQQFQPVKTVLQLSILKNGDTQNPLSVSSTELNFEIPGQKLSSMVQFPEVILDKGGKYQVKYEILSGGPIRLQGEPITLETSWDDALPLTVKGFDPLGGIYDPLNLELYEPDTPTKREKMIQILDEAEYIVIPSNRAYDSMPRLPNRYPMTLKYYQELFGCDCMGDDLENHVYQMEAPFKSPLGFELVRTFQSNPSIGPFSINDQNADESFTVYDHPKVLIFKKSADFSIEHVKSVLYSVNLDDVLFQNPMSFTKAPTAMKLDPAKLAAQTVGGTWSMMFDRLSILNTNQGLAAIVWYLLLLLLGWLVFPLVFVFFRGLPDKGYPLARMAALVLISWLSWMLSSLKLVAFTRISILLSIGLITVISVHFGYRYKDQILLFLRSKWKQIAAAETVFLAVFLFMLSIRIGNPDLWQPWLGGEKPMDFAFFNAVIKTVYFPPENPWFAGHYINYYYYGYVIAAIPTKITGIIPSIAYNLILPSWYAMTGIGVFCIGYNLVSIFGNNRKLYQSEPIHLDSPEPTKHEKLTTKWAYFAASFAMISVILFGNFYEVKLFIKHMPDMVPLGWVDENGVEQGNGEITGAIQVLTRESDLPGDKGQWYFEASRPILNGKDDTPIAEFPYFTFLYGDMHPHMLSMLFYALAMGWILSLLVFPISQMHWIDKSLNLILGGIFIGVFQAAHTWDFYPFLGLTCLAILWSSWRSSSQISREKVIRIISIILIYVVLAKLFYLPFTSLFKTEYASIELWKGARTPLTDYFVVYGLITFIMVSLLVRNCGVDAARYMDNWSKSTWKTKAKFLVPFVLILGFSFVLWKLKYPVLIFAIWMLWGIIYAVFFKPRQTLLLRAAWILYTIGLLLTCLVEVVVLKGDSGRSNMVFRMYIEAWFYFGIAGSLALYILLSQIRKWPKLISFIWTPICAILILLSLSYAYLATGEKIADRWPGIENPPHTLDGSAFMLGGSDGNDPAIYDDDSRQLFIGKDYDAMHYLQDYVEGSPVIIEGHSSEYRWGSRFSIHTGLPTIIGWNWHIRQHNSLLDGAFIEKRINQLDEFYNSDNIDLAQNYIEKNAAEYILVGDLERAYYQPEGIEKFGKMVEKGKLEIVFGDNSPDTTTIFKVIH
jgi:YYY domain-containing protein